MRSIEDIMWTPCSWCNELFDFDELHIPENNIGLCNNCYGQYKDEEE